MSTWINPTQIPRPNRNDYPTTADFMLADGVWVALQNPNLNFLSATPDAQYASPEEYLDAMTVYAQSLLENKFPVPYAPVGWDPIGAAQSACSVCFHILSQVAVSAADPDSWSVLIAWIMGTGQLAGGHPQNPSAPPSSGTNAETGQSAAPAGSIL